MPAFVLRATIKIIFSFVREGLLTVLLVFTLTLLLGLVNSVQIIVDSVQAFVRVVVVCKGM